MIGTVVALLLVVGILVLSVQELRAKRRSFRPLIVGAVLGFIAVAVAAWDWLAGGGRPGEIVAGLAMLVLLAWTFVVRAEF